MILWPIRCMRRGGSISAAAISLALTCALFHLLGSKPVQAEIVAWGPYSYADPTNLVNVVAVASGASQSLALIRSGTVVGWGNSAAVPPDLTNAVAIASDRAALRNNGTVTNWGSYNYLLSPAVTNVVAIAGGDSFGLA